MEVASKLCLHPMDDGMLFTVLGVSCDLFLFFAFIMVIVPWNHRIV